MGKSDTIVIVTGDIFDIVNFCIYILYVFTVDFHIWNILIGTILLGGEEEENLVKVKVK
jgi:hypothetical protein